MAFSDRLANKYKDAFDETGVDYLKRMHGASQRMQTLLGDLLAYSRVATHARKFETVDLSAITQEVVSNLEISLEKTKGRVDIGELPTIEADPTQIYQLLQNLIGNAIKFHSDERSPMVVVLTTMNNGHCQLIVKDNGIGFDIQYIDRIFKPFQRLHNREEFEGTGMGLAICRRIVERHHGEITATSLPGEGSTFIVTLPINQTKGESQYES
jgi:light-regulated signal transduction histidine kinase (bacteriophytochrome)